ncbi:butyrophilin subfamily 3 member A3-like [Pteronotus mesoamericanus]|uniref:butyrophilin subfamily 3 member A3-like n=1 Tax=Pteronotus mesoamericanus TaxID=1884717 RepID=UPI0023EACD1E|nr:butyrophilin subfamily 3 member A3-like [Pteronotus parnellii mesoamericanus]
MARGPVLSLRALRVCLALVQLLSPCSAAQFAVVGPPEPILALVGEDAKLPCHLSPRMSAETMELRWVRASPRQVVLTYARGQEDTPAAEYQGRTSMLRENITEGKAVLLIRDVRASDNGTFLCYFQDGDFSENAQVELQVAALGSEPHVELRGHEAGGARVGCTSAGWFPRPVIEWRDASGRSLPAEAAPAAADPQGLYAATAFVVLEGGSGQDVSCVFRNPLLGQEESARVSIAGPFFRNLQPSVVALAVTLVAPLGLLVGTGWFLWRQQKKIQALSQEKQGERSAKEKLQDELRWREIPYLPREEQSQAYAELKTALFQPADVLLDPDTAHPALRVSEDKRSLWREDSWEDLPDAPGRFTRIECVLGCASFTSGRRFWEVDVGDRKQWRVGLCRDNVSRKGGIKMSPENGFWTVGLYHGSDYQALTDPPTKLTNVHPPERVGVFLDYNVGQVSFYNALDGSHIFSFPHTPFSGPLRPVFRVLTAEGTPLTLCAAQRAVGTSLVPVPGPDPSPETPGSLDSAEWNGDPQAEVMCVLAAQSGAEGPLNSKTSQQENTKH